MIIIQTHLQFALYMQLCTYSLSKIIRFPSNIYHINARYPCSISDAVHEDRWFVFY